MRDVLIADDDQFMVETLCDILSLHGWNTTGVSSGEEALRVSAGASLSCIIMDIKMDGEDGFSIMQRIKRSQSIPVILMTAYTADELMAEVRRNGTLQAIDDLTPVDEVANDIERANARGDHVMLLSRRPGLLENLQAVLEPRGLPVFRVGERADLLTEFERTPPGASLVHVPADAGVDAMSYLITGLDAGVWVALSSHLPHLAGVLSHTVKLADGFFRKPLAIPQLVEHLHAVAAV